MFGVTTLIGDDDDAAQPLLRTTADNRSDAVNQLSFPALATKNSTRIAGADATDDAAAVALVRYPSAGGTDRAPAVTIVPSADWAAGVAASVLAGEPIGAPVLIGDKDEVPDQTEAAISALRPEGTSETDDAQAFLIGDVSAPDDLKTTEVPGKDAAEIAAEIDRVREKLVREKPQSILLASTEDPAFAMPAAAWAARSGDPVLFVERNRVPKATVKALQRHEGTPAFLLGPESVASDQVVKEVEKLAPAVQRISGDDPVTNAIAFARFESGTFGWAINDPGHGLVLANAGEPMTAAAASPLSASGKWGPLLLTDTPDVVPAALRGYLLDIKPGYRTDPTRAFYNHAWLIGNTAQLTIPFQAEIDELLELVQIQPPPGT